MEEQTTKRAQYAEAIAIAASKVEKKEKLETREEMFKRIAAEKEVKRNKSVTSAAKKMVKKKRMKTMAAYFKKK
jgi:hypothetical protein